jgi:hypothetical protein
MESSNKEIPCALLIDDNDDNDNDNEKNKIELVLFTNRDIEMGIPIPVSETTHPELLIRRSKYDLYKYCIVVPLSFIIIIAIIYYT